MSTQNTALAQRIRITEGGLTVAADMEELESRFSLAVRQRELLADYIKKRLDPKKHFYEVPGGAKASLNKEGAEVICLAHGYKPAYEKLAGPDQPPEDGKAYQLTVKCRLLLNDSPKGEALGSASSWITKRDGSRRPRQNDPGLCHNATLKMAQKSAYIAATLNSTAASEFFTQDLDNDETSPPESKAKAEIAEMGYCPVHKVPFQHRQGVLARDSKDGKHKKGEPYDFWACPTKVEGKFCKEQPQSKASAPLEGMPEGVKDVTEPDEDFAKL